MRSYARFNRKLTNRYGDWMKAMHYCEHTQRSYGRIIGLYLNFIEDRSIATATHEDIRRYIAKISEDGATIGVVYRHLSVLRVFYDFLNLGGVVDYVAPRLVKLPRPSSNSPRPLSESQVRRLITATRTLRERALIEFLYGTGCRLKEAARLKIEDIDFEDRSVRVFGKFRKFRVVFLTQEAVEALTAYIASRRKGLVFQPDWPVQRGGLSVRLGFWIGSFRLYKPDGTRHNRVQNLGRIGYVSRAAAEKKLAKLAVGFGRRRPQKRPLTNMCIQSIVKGVARRAGIQNVTPHTLRRTFATHLHEHGAGLEVIKALLGHVWIQTTEQYTPRMGPDQIARTFERCHPGGSLHVQAAQ